MNLTERYDRALAWASELHRDQRRKGSDVPYLTHLLSVSSLVVEHGGDEDQAIAGLLHDSIEDVGVTDDQIVDRFGDRVARIVRECTDADTVPKPPWLERKRAYIAHLGETESDVLIVSLADKFHNATSLAEDVDRVGEDYFDLFKGRADGIRWYYRRLADVFERRVDELPARIVDGRLAANGQSLLNRFVRTIERFGCTPAGAERFESRTASGIDDQGV